MRASRLLSILLLLQARGRMTAQALADEFEVSVRTVYRDVDDLSAAGVPVYADRGRAGGFRLLDGYRTRLTGMTPAETEALFLSGLPGPAEQLGLGQAMAAAQLKVLAALPEARREGAPRVGARVHLDPVGWFRTAERTDLLPALAAAVWDARRVRIRYESWTNVVERALEPLGLVLKAGIWYVVAASGGKPRTYRVSSIAALETTGEGFARPDDFDLPGYWTAWARDFEARLFRGRATVRLSPLGLKRLNEASPAGGVMAAQTGRPTGDGWIEAEIPVEIEGLDHASLEILRLGPEVEVSSPTTLRARVAEMAGALAARHAGAMTDEDFMRRAIEIAQGQVGRTGDNPAVGCVIVQAGRIVAEGVTGDGGRPHGEEVALTAAGDQARGATAYVTLEPCAQRSSGTVSCSGRLSAAGVVRVVAACADASVYAGGRGAEVLHAHGVQFDLGLLGRDAADLYALYRPAKAPEIGR